MGFEKFSKTLQKNLPHFVVVLSLLLAVGFIPIWMWILTHTSGDTILIYWHNRFVLK